MQEVLLESKQDRRIQDFQDWFEVSGHNGWLVYKRELEKLYETYNLYMDNLDATPELLKSYQLVKRGLKMALDIPKVLENKSKLARKEK